MPPSRTSSRNEGSSPSTSLLRGVKLYYNDKMSLHTHEWPHVEKCTRASNAFEHISKRGLLSQVDVLPGHVATDEEVLTVHSQRHIDEVKRMTDAAKADPTNRELREPDGPGGVYYSPEADATARLACGCVIDAARSVLRESKGNKERAPPAFALVRPPGHHAGADDSDGHHAEGFCFYNSVSVAAGVVRKAGTAQKVCILDWDVHHGNGTQAIFYDDPNVLYISLHRYGNRWYPETGGADEIGAGAGAGTTLNVPWPSDGFSDTDYLVAFKLVVLPVLTAFAPDLLLISAGFDAADGDAQGRMKITPRGFACMTELLLNAVSCPVAAALEGGYNSLVTSECCEAVLRTLIGEPASEPPPTLLQPTCEPTLREVIDQLKPHWPCLRYKKAMLDDFFAEAQRVGQAPRVSKRARVATQFADEEPKGRKAPVQEPKKPSAAQRAKERKERQAARQAEVEKKVDLVTTAMKEVDAARRRAQKAEEDLAKAEEVLASAKEEADKAAAEAAAADDELSESSSSESEDDTNGCVNPRRVTLWSAKVKCEAGRRVFAQFGDDEDELWFRATVVGVVRNDIGQYVDVEYDDGDVERMKPIKRVRAYASSSEEESSDEEDE